MTAWDARMMALAGYVAGWSKDRSTQVGCVIVGPRNDVRAIGYNGFPRGCDDDAEHRHERPLKYRWTEHAERNAVYNAAAVGTPLAECRIYIPWYPCADCARAIIQVGITEVIAIEPKWDDERWGYDFAVTREMFQECGVNVRFFRA